jgi:hypothetical protein
MIESAKEYWRRCRNSVFWRSARGNQPNHEEKIKGGSMKKGKPKPRPC